MQEKVEKPSYDLPVLRMSNNIEKISEEINDMKKVDISKVSPINQNNNNERIVYMQRPEQKPAKILLAHPNEKTSSETQTILSAAKNNSFFSTLMTHLNKENEIMSDKRYLKSEILTKNLLCEMKEHWQGKKEDIKLDIKNKEMQQKIVEKIGELQKLETEWQTKELMIEEYKKQLDFVERLIEEKGIELKKTIKTARFEETAKNPFIFSNGKAVKSINELLDALKALDHGAFGEHVNEMKNDFSSWILNEFNDESLSKRIKDAYSKDDIIAILEMF